jgi:predicted small metal-binding protein
MPMGAVITCECGFEARAADEEGLVAEVRRHAAETHCMPLSHEEALLLVVRAELAAQRTTPRETTDPSEEEEK